MMLLQRFLLAKKHFFMRVQKNLRGKGLAKFQAVIENAAALISSTSNGGRTSPILANVSFKACEREKKRPSGRSVCVRELVCVCVFCFVLFSSDVVSVLSAAQNITLGICCCIVSVHVYVS